jgi:hypothetical protein
LMFKDKLSQPLAKIENNIVDKAEIHPSINLKASDHCSNINLL